VNCLVLDTNAYTHLLSGSELVLAALSEAETIYMSVFVLGELYAGFKGGSREKENREVLSAFLHKPSVKLLNATNETAEVFASVKHLLRKKGNPIPVNDIWIAAHTIESGSVLMTFDAHFTAIDGLRIYS